MQAHFITPDTNYPHSDDACKDVKNNSFAFSVDVNTQQSSLISATGFKPELHYYESYVEIILLLLTYQTNVLLNAITLQLKPIKGNIFSIPHSMGCILGKATAVWR